MAGLFARRRRIELAGIDEWPELYAKGEDTLIMRATNYLPPKGYISGRSLAGLRAGLTWIAAIVLFLIASGEDAEPGYLYGAIGLTVLAVHWSRPSVVKRTTRRWGGKTVSITFTPKKIVIEGGPNGRQTIKADPAIEVSSRLESHDHAAEEELKVKLSRKKNDRERHQRNLTVYQQSFWVDLIYGTQVVRIADVYGQLEAERLSNGIQVAGQVWQDMLQGQGNVFTP